MSLKNGRKTKRKSVEDPAFKLPVIKSTIMNKPEEIIKEIVEDLKSNTEEEKPIIIEDAVRITRSHSSPSPKKSINSSDSSENDLHISLTDSNISITDSNGHNESKSEEVEKVEVSKETANENGTQEDSVIIIEVTPPQDTQENLEEYHEVDIELRLEESSDSESAPLMGRCVTRRSQHRNIPTPKTPKPAPVPEPASEQNTDNNIEDSDPKSIIIIDSSNDSFKEGTSEQISVTTNENEPIEVTESEVSEKSEVNESIQSSESSVSTLVNVGSDVTREVDLSVPDIDNTFLNINKDLSIVETLRRLRSRSAIHANRDYRKNLLISNTEKVDYTQLLPHTERIPGQKHKLREESPDGSKRFKLGTPSSPSLMSYVTNPFIKLRNKFSGEETTQSTPKLTCYKKQDMNEMDASIAEEAIAGEEKKWCSIM